MLNVGETELMVFIQMNKSVYVLYLNIMIINLNIAKIVQKIANIVLIPTPVPNVVIVI